MAIQHRRGVYERFDPTKLVAGEWAVVLSGDESADDGRAAYICFAPGTVKRVATFEDMMQAFLNANDELIDRFTSETTENVVTSNEVWLKERIDPIQESEAQRVVAESERKSAETMRVANEENRVTEEEERRLAELARATAETAREGAESARATAEAERVVEFSNMMDAALGVSVKVAATWDAETGLPTIDDPLPSTIYLVPQADEGNDCYVEWLWLSDRWERIGTTQADLAQYRRKDVKISSVDIADNAVKGANLAANMLPTYWGRIDVESHPIFTPESGMTSMPWPEQPLTFPCMYCRVNGSDSLVSAHFLTEYPSGYTAPQ